jgi:hypothetical protein
MNYPYHGFHQSPAYICTSRSLTLANFLGILVGQITALKPFDVRSPVSQRGTAKFTRLKFLCCLGANSHRDRDCRNCLAVGGSEDDELPAMGQLAAVRDRCFHSQCDRQDLALSIPAIRPSDLPVGIFQCPCVGNDDYPRQKLRRL